MSNRVCHFKLVLLGDTAVGKSCLVVRFVRDEFFEFQEPTIGGEAYLFRTGRASCLKVYFCWRHCADLVLDMFHEYYIIL